MNLAMDTATSDIRALEFTPGSAGDSPVLPELLDQIPEGEEIGTVTARSHGLRANQAGQWMRCIKAFGERILARDPDSQTAETQIRGALINRFNALGTADIIRLA